MKDFDLKWWNKPILVNFQDLFMTSNKTLTQVLFKIFKLFNILINSSMKIELKVCKLALSQYF